MNLYSAEKGGGGGGVWEGGEGGVCGGVVMGVAEIPTSVLVGVEVSGPPTRKWKFLLLYLWVLKFREETKL